MSKDNDNDVEEAAGSSMLKHFASSRAADEFVTIEWKNVNFSTLVKDKSKSTLTKAVYTERKILRDLHGQINSGELLAIMGPTGCGKTSFLNVLSARVASAGSSFSSLQGTITINGIPRDDNSFRNISGYVTQDDMLFSFLTVEETLLLAAHFYLPPETTMEMKMGLVNSVIADLSLKKAKDTIIGNEKVRGVSGGERRRASIAVQLIADPAVLFLDEPTSGLDAFQAQSVMESMKHLSNIGRLVVAVIHQPRSSIYNMFHKLLLLSEGRTMFYGDASDALQYFNNAGQVCPANFNPSDFFLDMLSPDFRTLELEKTSRERIVYLGDYWEIHGKYELTKHSGKFTQVKNIGSDINLSKLYRNFILLCWRAFTEQSRNKGVIIAKIVFSSFFALIIGGIYSNIGHHQKSVSERVAVLFIVSINQSFNSMLSVLPVFSREKLIINRERSARAYNTVAYFVAKVAVETPLNILPAIFYSCVFYWLVGLNPHRFGYFILICMLINLSAIALGMFIGAACPNYDIANALSAPVLIVMILFGGFYISVSNLPIVANWVPYISILRWGFEALVLNEFKDLKFDCNGAVNGACITTGEQEIRILGFQGHTTAYPVFGLGMNMLGFFAIACIILSSQSSTFTNLGHNGLAYLRFSGNSETDVYQVIPSKNNEENKDNNIELVVKSIE